MQVDAALAHSDSELVLGLVAPVGTDLDQVTKWLGERLEQFRYVTEPIRLSDFAGNVDVKAGAATSEYDRVSQLMTAGNEVRRRAEAPEILALYAANAIHQRREGAKEGAPRPSSRKAYVLRSLKRPEEVAALRRIYGAGFFLIAVSSSNADRVKYLTTDKGMLAEQAAELLKRDEAEEHDDFGQRTRETYHLADVFVADKEHVWRFLDLVFGEPFHTPTRPEYAMFLAFAASVRSADLSRQVGAVVVSKGGEVIAMGANDVPSKGGGSYWPDDQDQRDYKLGIDPNEARREAMILDITRRFRPELENQADPDVLAEGKKLLKGSAVFDITEFHRAVHAEMDALLTCARLGHSVVNATLYTTTYPCHNCAKHIVGAGIDKVVYVEPYAKSLAEALHGDAIKRASASGENKIIDVHDKVPFEPFVGVGARRFIDLFSMTLGSGDKRSRKGDGGRVKIFDRSNATLRVPMMPNSYLEREAVAAAVLAARTEQESTHEEARS